MHTLYTYVSYNFIYTIRLFNIQSFYIIIDLVTTRLSSNTKEDNMTTMIVNQNKIYNKQTHASERETVLWQVK